MEKIIRLTERDLTRLIKRIVTEGVTISETPAGYGDISRQMKPGTQTSATLYFDEGNNINIRVGSTNLLLFNNPADQQSAQPAK